ncbi:MAG: 2'-5' RNA ligase, partial [Candidatus Nitrosothermus koennekii]
MDLELINELREYGLQYIVDKYSLIVKYHNTWPNLVLLKYSQVETNLKYKAARQARGIILDTENDWRVVAYPYDKFFNHGEPLAADIDWSTAAIYEKLDGTLCTLYWYNNQWNVATPGSPDASGVCNNGKTTFADLFWKTFYELDYKLPEDTKLCYMFELMTSDNEIVVKHSRPRLVLHGIRDISHYPYLEQSPTLDYRLKYNWEVVRKFDKTSSLEELLTVVKNIDGTTQEGFVVRDASFNRLKVKAPTYVELHYFANNFSDKR